MRIILKILILFFVFNSCGVKYEDNRRVVVKGKIVNPDGSIATDVEVIALSTSPVYQNYNNDGSKLFNSNSKMAETKSDSKGNFIVVTPVPNTVYYIFASKKINTNSPTFMNYLYKYIEVKINPNKNEYILGNIILQ